MDKTTLDAIKTQHPKMTRVVVFEANEDTTEEFYFPGMYQDASGRSTPTMTVGFPAGVYLEKVEITNMSDDTPVLIGLDPSEPHLGINLLYDKGLHPFSPGKTLSIEIPSVLQKTKFVPGQGDVPDPDAPHARKEDITEWYLTCNVQDISKDKAVDVMVEITFYRGSSTEYT